MNTQNLTLAASQETEKESDVLARQLVNLERRRDEWAIQAEQAESRLAETQSKALAGEASASDVTTAQSEHSALAGLLSQADTQVSDLSGKLQATRRREAREANERRIAELNAQREENTDSYDARLATLNDFLNSSISKLSEGQQREAALCREITSLGGALEIPPLGARRWSDSGLKYAQHIAQMIAEAYREKERAARKREPPRAA
jgi:chromosome segregation ATPase